VRSTANPNLEGLDDLARRNGVDIRPTLVRVLTDLYVQKPLHTAEEEQHYTELVLRLIEGVDLSTRAIVASKLADYPAAPLKIVQRLARDAPEVADPILRHSPRLSSAELLAIIAECGPRYASVIAERRPGTCTSAALNDGTDDQCASGTLLSAGTTAARTLAPGAMSASGPETDIRLGELFLAAGSEERRLILANLGGGRTVPAPPWMAGAADAVRRLEAAALGRSPDTFIAELEAALGLPEELARRLVTDPSGEPLLVAAKALATPPDVFLRVLLFLDPAIGQSVDRVFDLSRLYDQLAPDAAVRLVASLRDGGSWRRRTPAYQPVHFTEENDRVGRAAIEAARRHAGSAAPGSGQDARPPAAPGRRHGTT